LYLLTVADVRATNPKLWNSWKAQIFDETYELTKRALRYGLTTPIDKDELLREKRARALELLQPSGTSEAKATQLWTTFGEEYLLRCKPEEIAWQTVLLADFDIVADETLVDIQDSKVTAGTIAFIYAPQKQFTFALATAALDEFGLSITDARIIPLANEHSLSMYTILEQDGQAINDESRRDKIRQRLAKAIRSGAEEPGPVTRKVPRQVRMFSTPTDVEFGEDLANNRTVMELTTGDKPGLLAQAAKVLRSQGMLMRMAKIVTVGERAEDVFYILNAAREMLTPEQQESLRVALKQAIDNNA
jgi:[protein-PII] uridylyltransferase